MKTENYFIIALALFLMFVGGVMEYAFKVGIPTVNYGRTDTVRIVSKPIVVHDTTPKLINTVSVKIDTVHDTLVSSVQTDTIATFSTGKRYLDGDSIAVAVSSRILPVTPPTDWCWTLDRWKQPDTCFSYTRIDSVQIPVKLAWYGKWYVQIPLMAIIGYGGYQVGRHWKP